MVQSTRPATVEDARAVAEVHVARWQEGYRGLIALPYLDALSAADCERGWASGLEADLRTRAGSTARHADGGSRDAPAPVRWVLEGDVRARRSYQRQGWTPDGVSRTDQRPALGEVPGIAFTEVRHRLAGHG